MRFRRGDNTFGDLERQLRIERTVPSAGLQRTVSELTSTLVETRPHIAIRVAVAGALTLVTVLTAAVLGATSYAGNGNSGQANGQQGGNAEAGQDQNSSDSQYGEKVIVCHRSSSTSKGETLRLSREGAKSHLREHRYDTAGPCQ